MRTVACQLIRGIVRANNARCRIATAKAADGRPRPVPLVGYQLGRAALTLAGPWLPHPAWLDGRLPFVCRPT